MAEMNMPEQKQTADTAADEEEKDDFVPLEMTDRRGPLIVLGAMLLPPLILALVELLRPAN